MVLENVKKYLLYFMLLENVAVQTSLFGAYSSIFFNLFLGLGLLFILTGEVFKANAVKTFLPLYILVGIYLFYGFTIGASYIDNRSLTYLAAKMTTFAIIITSVNSNYEFYETKGLYHLALFMCFFVMYGLATGGLAEASIGRSTMGFTNSNTTSGMGAFILGIVLFLTKKWNWKTIVITVIGLYAILAGGSRAGVLVAAIIIFMRYGISLKIIMMSFILVVTSLFVVPAIGLETVGVERMIDTVEGLEGTNRDVEREACLMMIREKPLMGWGFEAQNQGKASVLSLLGSHNGYMETLKFMGIPMGGLWIAVYLLTVLRLYLKYRKYKLESDVYLAMLIAFTVNAYYEGLFVGVHEFATNLIFVAMTMTCKKLSIHESLNNRIIYYDKGNKNKRKF